MSCIGRSAVDVFQVEKIPDRLLMDYLNYDRLPLDALPEQPRDRQKLLGLDIVSNITARKQHKKPASSYVPSSGKHKRYIFCTRFSLSQVKFPAKLFIFSVQVVCVKLALRHGADSREQSDWMRSLELCRYYLQFTRRTEGKVLQVGKTVCSIS
jgi:tyrosyl-tRNA synthetase